MKTIKLNEKQMSIFANLIESESAPDFEDGDIKEFGDSTEVGTNATIQDDEGNPKYGKMPIGDEISQRLCPQNYWLNSMHGGKGF